MAKSKRELNDLQNTAFMAGEFSSKYALRQDPEKTIEMPMPCDRIAIENQILNSNLTHGRIKLGTIILTRREHSTGRVLR